MADGLNVNEERRAAAMEWYRALDARARGQSLRVPSSLRTFILATIVAVPISIVAPAVLVQRRQTATPAIVAEELHALENKLAATCRVAAPTRLRVSMLGPGNLDVVPRSPEAACVKEQLNSARHAVSKLAVGDTATASLLLLPSEHRD
ncbi:MAG: hypothetical protein IPG50_17135 [Myxococcales bacterium]|nr:hypothetical protein [Myxococcales bacterium]